VNQPVKDLATGKVQITSHNHGFAVAPPGAGGTGPVPLAPFDTPFGRAQVSHINLNDGVVEGIRLLDAPAFSVQYHPEAAPGPHDAAGEFDAFCALMEGTGSAGAGAERGRDKQSAGAGQAERGGGTSGAGARHAQA
jgi:carbamoyl-phosphate synthase small subunit